MRIIVSEKMLRGSRERVLVVEFWMEGNWSASRDLRRLTNVANIDIPIRSGNDY
ncbi:MAG TPA: hypothetical protein VFE24_01755 [Pirellulales bacterium]|jgi:hypothetical protein|nr:hypothetical protein [Pirellulales bacterium]